MEQLASSIWPFSSFFPSFTDPTTSADMSYNNRQLSPGGRRIANAGRVSESAINDPSYHQRNNSYASPRSSGVIPLSTITYVSTPQSSIARPASRHDSYSSRPRRSSLVDHNRSSGTVVNQIPSRSRPAIIQTEPSRPSSPGRAGEQRGSTSHKKVYSIDDGAARLVADVNLPVRTVVERNHRRRDSDTERSNRRLSDLARDRGQKVYHSNGQSRPVQPSIDAEDAFSYTDPAGMYRDTEPRWREVRPRRGSLDRANRERPVSMVDPTADQRRVTREVGPPPSTRGWDRINEGLGRTRNARDAGREVSQSPSRGRGYTDSRDAYYGQSGSSTGNRPVAMPYPERYDDYGYEEARSPRRHERGNSFSRPERPDRSVERRGFGIRNDFGSTSHDPYSQGSDENLEQTSRYRDATYAEPQRHNTVPDYSYHESRRQEPDRRDRGDRQREPRDKETRRRDDDRSYDRDYDRTRDQEYDVDRERERERARQLEPPSDSDRDRHHRRENDRKDNSPRHSGDNVSSPSLSQAASGGLAGVAAALGASSLLKKVTGDKSEREDRDRDRPRDKRSDDDRDYDREKERDRQRDRERDRGLGFAYENRPESPRVASIAQDRPITRETSHESADKPISMPAPAMDPNEEYRRRMEQIQRELGGSADARNSGDEADRERRRRERDSRSSGGRGFDTDAPSSEATSYDYPPPSASRRTLEVDDRSQITGSSVGSSDSRRRQSILDRPMTNEPAEIIDNTQSEKRENRVRIVDPPTEEEDKKPKGILKKPTEKFPEDANVIREGVAPLKDSTKKGIPPGARWTKIDRRLVNPEALTKQGERFEERLDCVIVLRVLTKEEIQKLADLTREIRDQRHDDDRSDRRSSRRHDHYRGRDEYSDDSENEFKERTPRMLEAPPSSTGASSETDFVRDSRDRRQDRDRKSDSSYSMSGGAGKRE